MILNEEKEFCFMGFGLLVFYDHVDFHFIVKCQKENKNLNLLTF